MMQNKIYGEIYSSEEIMKMFEEKRISKTECLLLLSAKDDISFGKFVSGGGEFKLYYDRNVDPKLYFTNVPMMLQTIYDAYLKYPNYHFEKRLENFLMTNAKFPGYAYKILTILDYHIQNEKNNISTFKLNNVIEILEICKNTVKNNIEYFKVERMYEGRYEEQGYFSVIQKYNANFKEILNYDLFDDDEFKKINI